MKYHITNRGGSFRCEVEIDCPETAGHAGKLGLAVRAARARNFNLREADLRYSDLRGANLSGTNLRGADLSGADLRYSDLSGADLRDTNLRGADLSGSDLGGADLSGAEIGGVKGIIWAGYPDGWLAFGYVHPKTKKLSVRVGCRNLSLSEGRAYWSSPVHPYQAKRREILAALDYIEAVARLREWEV